MRTLTTSVGPLSHALTTGSHDWHLRGASILDAVHSWYVAAMGAAQVAALSPRAFADIFSDAAPQSRDNHVRDEFGRPIH